MFWARFIADAFLDHSFALLTLVPRYSRYMNWQPVSGEPMKMLQMWYPLLSF